MTNLERELTRIHRLERSFRVWPQGDIRPISEIQRELEAWVEPGESIIGLLRNYGTWLHKAIKERETARDYGPYTASRV